MMDKVFFYLYPDIDRPVYEHCSLSLAEGLISHGFTVKGNREYWWDHAKSNFTIPYGDYDEDSDYTFVSANYLIAKGDLPYIHTNTISVLIDDVDGRFTFSHTNICTKFNIVLKCHYLQRDKVNFAKNVYPWSFGLTERIIRSISFKESKALKNEVGVSYRVGYNFRSIFVNTMLRYKNPAVSFFTSLNCQAGDKKSYWYQTFFRHDEDYFRFHNEYKYGLAVGGDAIVNFLPFAHGNRAIDKLSRFVSRRVAFFFMKLDFFRRFVFVYQFDSWRFWELMVSRSLPISACCDDWGFIYPVMPLSNEHYIGIKRNEIKTFPKKINTLTDHQLKKISQTGHQFALDHYSPRAVAARFLSIAKNNQ